MEIDREKLVRLALEQQANAYAPYSRFFVGAAVLCESGKVYTGANVENASFPAGMCAERNAICQAAARGERRILAVAVAGGIEGRNRSYCAPCGVCRQMMREFCDPKEMRVLMAKSPEDWKERTLEQLLPDSFGPEELA